jgi:hypothetical protein
VEGLAYRCRGFGIESKFFDVFIHFIGASIIVDVEAIVSI